MMPFLPLVSFAAVAMGMLNAEERFAAPAFAPAMFNVVAIVWGAVLWAMGFPPRDGRVRLGGRHAPGRGRPVPRPGAAAAADGLALPAGVGARRSGPRAVSSASWRPPIVGLAAVQLNIFVNSIFASHEPGAVSWLNYAFRILYLPIGLFGVALGHDRHDAASRAARRRATWTGCARRCATRLRCSPS